MPKDTFNNLPEDKRNRFISAFLKEFTLKKYDDASISKVLKELKMAKGSFYQYFDNKADLLNYLVQTCGLKKFEYISEIKRENFDNFWSYWKALYTAGLKMDEEHPLMSNFMFSLQDTLKSPTLKDLYDNWQKQGLNSMIQLIEPEIANGCFRSDIPIEFMAHTLLVSSNNLLDFINKNHAAQFEENMEMGKPIFRNGNDKIFIEVMKNNIELMKSAFEKR